MPKMKPQIFKHDDQWWLAREAYGLQNRVECFEIDSMTDGIRRLSGMHGTAGFGNCPQSELASNWDRDHPRSGWGWRAR